MELDLKVENVCKFKTTYNIRDLIHLHTFKTSVWEEWDGLNLKCFIARYTQQQNITCCGSKWHIENM